MKERILIVEDEAGIRTGLCDLLAYHGYDPCAVESGEEALRAALGNEYALILLDVMLPGLSGFDVCEQLRAKENETPIIMLTAKGAEEDVLEGFSRGCDDYISKPFSVRELMARVKARLPKTNHAASNFKFGGWDVDHTSGIAKANDDEIQLTPREVSILALLVRDVGRIVGRRTLLAECWDAQSPDDLVTRTVDVHIAKLRKKVDGKEASLIETIRGRGYRYRGP